MLRQNMSRQRRHLSLILHLNAHIADGVCCIQRTDSIEDLGFDRFYAMALFAIYFEAGRWAVVQC
jgi:hypothetical protein